MADHHPEIDAVTGRTTTGHEWDGIKELNTPLPRWWLYIFYATIVWSIGYWVVYPAWPLVTNYTQGRIRLCLAQPTSSATSMPSRPCAAERSAALARTARRHHQGSDAADLRARPGQGGVRRQLRALPRPGGAGARGYPNLNDDDWLWGGTIEDIHQTIAHGIRNGDDRARQGNMPALGGPNGVLKPDEVITVANFVRSLSGQSTRPGTNLAKGKELFIANCAACHGEEGRGNRELGAPNLTGRNWVYGSDERTIIETINNGRGGVMPGWATRLDETTVKALAVYVHTLGGGQ
jgi:cytochrome c oxidase cbb3-type subunit 3